MKVVVTGGAGFIGGYVVRELLKRENIIGKSGKFEQIEQLIIVDIMKPREDILADPRVHFVTQDISDPDVLKNLIDHKTSSFFHFGAVLTSAAEDNFDLAMRVNVHSMMALLEVLRSLPNTPRLIFASSIATYGGELPEVVDENTAQRPQSTYGTSKAISELLINDYTRRGFIDGRALRVPFVIIRPKDTLKGVSNFPARIIREPMKGIDVLCPLSPESRIVAVSPNRLAEACVLIHDLPGEAIGHDRTINIPSISLTLGEMVETLQRIYGDRPLGKITWDIDQNLQKLVDSWPRHLNSHRANALGIRGDDTFEDIIRAYENDHLP